MPASASSVAASSYSARAWPISFCAIDENATSSSRNGAIPVHSDSRQPRISSSSASSRSSATRSLTRLLQPHLDRVAVDAAVLEVELVGPVVDDVHRVARDEPERDRLAAAAVLLARGRLREPRGRSQSPTASPRRPYCSRAYASANGASGATTEPACSNGSPFRSWRNTSQ